MKSSFLGALKINSEIISPLTILPGCICASIPPLYYTRFVGQNKIPGTRRPNFVYWKKEKKKKNFLLSNVEVKIEHNDELKIVFSNRLH